MNAIIHLFSTLGLERDLQRWSWLEALIEYHDSRLGETYMPGYISTFLCLFQPIAACWVCLRRSSAPTCRHFANTT